MKKIILITFCWSFMNVANAELTRDNSTQVITDNDTKLQWEDDAANPVKKEHPDAVKHCANLNFAGHADWRLPSFDELENLAKATKVKFPKKPILKSLPTFGGIFWTSETHMFGEPAATGVKFDNFDYGKRGEAIQRIEYSVRCVRSSK
ncbi:hypothetical protein MNBD_GAMMA03-1307 [hydrothermal vent metagenome]|uniref:Lcl C-terminal domain-containing protein n=1 Tax=hydrothermal vent metagenome TaxID=652676 RepID=A0A3B0WW45_9ZZZZ